MCDRLRIFVGEDRNPIFVECVPRATEPPSRNHRSQSRADQLKIHEIDPEIVRVELGQAGFQVLKCEDPFLKRMPEVKNGDRIAAADMWLIIAVRPK